MLCYVLYHNNSHENSMFKTPQTGWFILSPDTASDIVEWDQAGSRLAIEFGMKRIDYAYLVACSNYKSSADVLTGKEILSMWHRSNKDPK